MMEWFGGTQQTGYQLLRVRNGNIQIVATLPANATTFTDPDDEGLSCYQLATLGTTPARTSDFECTFDGLRSGASPPRRFSIRLNQTYTAQLDWLPPTVGTPDAYRVLELGGGVYNLPAGTTTVKLPVTADLTCFSVQALRQGAIIGQSNGACASPGYSNLGF
jgi:hypothetical protein